MHNTSPEECSGLFFADGSELQFGAGSFVMTTPDEKALPLPSSLLFDAHARFAAALHHFWVKDKIAEGWPPSQRGGLLFYFFFFFPYPYHIYK